MGTNLGCLRENKKNSYCLDRLYLCLCGCMGWSGGGLRLR